MTSRLHKGVILPKQWLPQKRPYCNPTLLEQNPLEEVHPPLPLESVVHVVAQEFTDVIEPRSGR